MVDKQHDPMLLVPRGEHVVRPIPANPFVEVRPCCSLDALKKTCRLMRASTGSEVIRWSRPSGKCGCASVGGESRVQSTAGAQPHFVSLIAEVPVGPAPLQVINSFTHLCERHEEGEPKLLVVVFIWAVEAFPFKLKSVPKHCDFVFEAVRLRASFFDQLVERFGGQAGAKIAFLCHALILCSWMRYG